MYMTLYLMQQNGQRKIYFLNITWAIQKQIIRWGKLQKQQQHGLLQRGQRNSTLIRESLYQVLSVSSGNEARSQAHNGEMASVQSLMIPSPPRNVSQIQQYLKTFHRKVLYGATIVVAMIRFS